MLRLCFDRRQMLAGSLALLVSAARAVADGEGAALARQCVTNAAQFKSLSGETSLEGCDFHLTGVVTLVDTNRDLTVLQDASGAVALNFPLAGRNLEVGELVTLDGSNCCPYFAPFPAYPYRPSGSNIQRSFEAPENWGEYNLTRLRGYVQPPLTGEYTFWIASDNSSELWLSLDAEPSKIRKIASIPRFSWTLSREWTRYPSQRSEPILLQAGESYYIEALSEQTTVGENLAVAWQGPSLSQSVIPPVYLTPWGPDRARTNGVLREYWTNFFAGDLTGMAGPRAFDSVVTADRVQETVHGPGVLPKPEELALDQPWSKDRNYHWVEVKGQVNFIGADGSGAVLELSGKRGQTQVRLPHWDPALAERIRHAQVQVQGVCEGVPDENDELTPGIIWASATNSLLVLDPAQTNPATPAPGPAPASATVVNPAPQALQGFYNTRGVVTFSDRVFGRDYRFVQEDAVSMLVSLEGSLSNKVLQAGEWVDLGGALQPGKPVPVLIPLALTELGFHSLPVPLRPPPGPAADTREGRWSELEGIVRSVNTNGALSLAGADGRAYLWIGQVPSNRLAGYVDAKVRARGVLLLTALEAPLLLVPSPDFVDLEEPPVPNPFTLPPRPIANVVPEKMASAWGHRVRVVGEVTYRDFRSFVVQDDSGGIRVQFAGAPSLSPGETVDVIAFPTEGDGVRSLTDAQVHPARESFQLKPAELDSETASATQSGTLVQLTATLLDRKVGKAGQVLELQEQQRIFAASLPRGAGLLPAIAAGSRVQITGVYENGPATATGAGDKAGGARFPGSFNILLRSSDDVRVLSGPPWWTWKRTATLVGALLTVLAVTLLWVRLLQRRLDRQRTAQLAFTRQVLAQVEEERRRIAANLHDSLGQILLAIKNHALLAIQRPPDEQAMRQRLDEISGASSLAIEEVRQITHGLRPYQLDRLGLTQAIRTSIERASANGSILFATRVEDIDGLFDKETEINVYRIVQESVTNVVKHSGATEAAVVIRKRTATVSLSVRDNGRGFDPAKPAPQQRELGYGLIGIKERVRVLGGTLTIDSRPGEGTSLAVEVPLPICKT